MIFNLLSTRLGAVLSATSGFQEVEAFEQCWGWFSESWGDICFLLNSTDIVDFLYGLPKKMYLGGRQRFMLFAAFLLISSGIFSCSVHFSLFPICQMGITLMSYLTEELMEGNRVGKVTIKTQSIEIML